MAQLHRYGRALAGTIRSTAPFNVSSVATASTVAQESLRSLACPLLFRSEPVHLWTSEASWIASSVHQDAAKERENRSSASPGPRVSAFHAMTYVNGQPCRLYSSAATGALNGKPEKKSKKQATPPRHQGGPQPAVAAKESWPQQYKPISRIEEKYRIPRKPVFAVIELGATQYKVVPPHLSLFNVTAHQSGGSWGTVHYFLRHPVSRHLAHCCVCVPCGHGARDGVNWCQRHSDGIALS